MRRPERVWRSSSLYDRGGKPEHRVRLRFASFDVAFGGEVRLLALFWFWSVACLTRDIPAKAVGRKGQWCRWMK